MTLLQNPGFEFDWEVDSSHRCLVFATDGTLLDDRQIGNVFTPSGGWVTWFVHDPGTWDQPEVRDAWGHHDERRVRSGRKATLLFTVYRKHAGGFLQQVQVEPGTTLRLSAWAHAWSNHFGPHKDDGWWSDGVGFAPRNERHEYDGSKNWYLEGGTNSSDIQNFTFWLGVDPTGGTNPLADTVVWGRGLHQYNEHVVPVPAVEAVAQAGTATVFLRSRTLWPFKHNDAYWDDASLLVVGEAPVASFTYSCDGLTCDFDGSGSHDPDGSIGSYDWDFGDGGLHGSGVASLHTYAAAGTYVVTLTVLDDSGMTGVDSQNVTVTEDDGECRGHPRVQYDRTVILLPPGSTWLWPTALSSVLERYRASIVYSADDAGIGDLDVRRIVAVNPQLWSIPQDVANGDYPGLEDFFEQYYPGVEYHPVRANLANVAADVAEVLEGLDGTPQNRPPEVDAGPDQTITLPAGVILDGAVTDDGLPDPPGAVTMNWSKVSGPGDVTFVDASVVDAMADFSEAGVYVLRLLADDGELTAHDDVAVTVQDEEPPEEPPWAGMEPVTLHVQKPVAPPDGFGDLEYALYVQPAGFKTVGYMEALERVKAVSPNTVTCYRQFVENQDEYIDVPDGPRRFLHTHLDSLNRLRDSVDLVEGLNEIWVPNELERLAEWYWYFAEALAAEGSPAAPLVGSIPVGNPPLVSEGGRPYIEAMLQMVEAAVRYGGAVGYHGYHRCYMNAVDPPWSENWLYYAGRFTDWDPIFNEHGLYPNYFISEAGAFLNALAGWGHAEVFDGRFPPYGQSLLELRDFINNWNAEHNYRTICYALFTYLPPGQGWRHYNLYGYARALAETLTGGPVGGPTIHTRIRRALSFVGLQDVGTDVANGKWVWSGRDTNRERYMNGG